MFDQLDQLQRGACELVPRQSAYNDSSAGNSIYGGAHGYQDEYGGYFDEGESFADENVDPMAHGGKIMPPHDNPRFVLTHEQEVTLRRFLPLATHGTRGAWQRLKALGRPGRK